MRPFSIRPDAESYTVRWRFPRRTPRQRGGEPADATAILDWLTIMAAALTVSLAMLLPAIYVLPALSLVALAAAAATGLLAWCTEADRGARHMTIWDFAGALALIGFVAGMLSDPAHVLQFFGLATTPE